MYPTSHQPKQIEESIGAFGVIYMEIRFVMWIQPGNFCVLAACVLARERKIKLDYVGGRFECQVKM